MRSLICSIKDTAIGSFMNPFTVPSEGYARRGFADEVNRVADNNLINKHPEHFELYIVGSFEDETGRIDSQPPELICKATQVKE